MALVIENFWMDFAAIETLLDWQEVENELFQVTAPKPLDILKKGLDNFLIKQDTERPPIKQQWLRYVRNRSFNLNMMRLDESRGMKNTDFFQSHVYPSTTSSVDFHL